MLNWFKQHKLARSSAGQLYRGCVAQARQQAFYAGWRVPDTVEGRYEMIALHLFLVSERLKGEGEEGLRLSRGMLESFVTDMDDNMREMGVGDMTVPKRVKRAAAGLYDRFGDYRKAMAEASDAPLSAALDTHIGALGTTPVELAPLADYMRNAAATLAGIAAAEFMAGKLDWPEPAGSASTTQSED